MQRDRQRVVIVGGGFGGLATAKALRRAPVDITLVDRRNHHLFQPLLYQVAGAALAPGDIAAPIRGVLAGQDNVKVLLGEATGVDLDQKVLHTDRLDLPYDTLVLAAGMRNHWFGNEDWAAHAPGLKTLDDALDLRRRILGAYERAEWATDPVARRRHLTFVVVGAGPTGVEMAGALVEIARQTLRRDFRSIKPGEARVVLVEGSDAVLRAMGPKLSSDAYEGLRKLGVEVLLERRITAVDAAGVEMGPERIESSTVVWAAGVKAAAIGEALDADLDRAGRVPIQPDLSLPGRPNVFVIGDMARLAGDDGQPLPGVAQVAIQMGKHVGRVLEADREQQARPAFDYKDLGSMATVGRRMAVARLGRLQFSGFVAWLVWLFVHLMALVGFRNRFVVLTQWAWNYLTFERNSRLIRLGLDENRAIRPQAEESLEEGAA
jgi:NADH:ubiquinone reductase (H+-translocating)